MRVVVVAAWPPWPLTDGDRLILHHHLRILSADHDLIMLAAGGPPGETRLAGGEHGLPPSLGARWFGPAVPMPAAADFAGRRLASELSGEPAHVHWVERPALRRALGTSIDVHRPEVVHLFGWGTAALQRLTGAVPVVHVPVDAWGLGHGNRLLPGWRRVADVGQAAKVRAHERRHYPACDAVVVVGPADAAYLEDAAPGSRVSVVANGVDAGPAPGPPADEPVVAFHGSFETAANVAAAHALVDHVVPPLRRRRPDARVVLIGRDPHGTVADLAGDGVTVTGEVSDVRAELAGVAVYAAPMTSGSGIKNKVLEAMAAGLPVVATPTALAGIGPSEGVVEAPLTAMAAAVATLLDSPTRRRAAGEANRRRVVEELSWERSASRMADVWADVAG